MRFCSSSRKRTEGEGDVQFWVQGVVLLPLELVFVDGPVGRRRRRRVRRREPHLVPHPGGAGSEVLRQRY